MIFSRVHATLQPVGRLVGWSVGRSVGHTLLFLSLLFPEVIFSDSKQFLRHSKSF